MCSHKVDKYPLQHLTDGDTSSVRLRRHEQPLHPTVRRDISGAEIAKRDTVNESPMSPCPFVVHSLFRSERGLTAEGSHQAGHVDIVAEARRFTP